MPWPNDFLSSPIYILSCLLVLSHLIHTPFMGRLSLVWGQPRLNLFATDCLVAMTLTAVLVWLRWGHSFLWNGTAWPQYLHHKWLRICFVSRMPKIRQHESLQSIQSEQSLQHQNMKSHYKQGSAQHNTTVDHHWTRSLHISSRSYQAEVIAEATVSNLLFMVLLVALLMGTKATVAAAADSTSPINIKY